MAEQPGLLFYRARDGLKVDNLPLFFGRVKLEGNKVIGKHYRARIEKVNSHYLIGYYWLELDADVFFQKFAEHEDVEIPQEEFETLLGEWTRHGRYPAFCWNPEEVPEDMQV